MLASAVDEIVAENPPQTAHRCLSTLLSIAQNISRDREKYGMLKGTNERLNKDVIQVEGGLDALIGMGFSAETDDLSNSVYYEFQSITHTFQLPKYIQTLTNALSVVKDIRRRGSADHGSYSSGGPSTLKSERNVRVEGFVDVKKELRKIGQDRRGGHNPRTGSFNQEEDGSASDSSSPTSSLYASSISSPPISRRSVSPPSTQPPRVPTARQRLEEQLRQRGPRVESAAEELRRVARERHGGEGMMSRMPEPEDDEEDEEEAGGAGGLLERFADTLPWWFRPLDAGILLVAFILVWLGLVDEDTFPGLLLLLVLYFAFMSRSRSSRRVGPDGSIIRPGRRSSTGSYRSKHMKLKEMQQREQLAEVMGRARYAEPPSQPHRLLHTLKSSIHNPPSPINLLESLIYYLKHRYDHLFLLSILLYLSIYVIYPTIQSTRHPAPAGTPWDGTKDLIISHNRRFIKPTAQQIHTYKIYFMSNPKLMKKMFLAGPEGCLQSEGTKREMCEAFWYVAHDREAWQQMWGMDKQMEEARIIGEIAAVKRWAAYYNPWLGG